MVIVQHVVRSHVLMATATYVQPILLEVVTVVTRIIMWRVIIHVHHVVHQLVNVLFVIHNHQPFIVPVVPQLTTPIRTLVVLYAQLVRLTVLTVIVEDLVLYGVSIVTPLTI